MILLDTDHLSVLKYDEHPRCRALRERMGRSQDPFFATTIIAAEEQMRGWLAKIHGAKDAAMQVAWYDQLAWLILRSLPWHVSTTPYCYRATSAISAACRGCALRAG